MLLVILIGFEKWCFLIQMNDLGPMGVNQELTEFRHYF